MALKIQTLAAGDWCKTSN